MKVTTPYASVDGVSATSRVVIDQQTITVPITTGVSLASLLSGAIIPLHAQVVEIQADGGIIRIGLKHAVTVTPTTGHRIDDGISYSVDSSLADVTLVANGAATVTGQAIFFDRV